jgi:ribosomal protein L21
MSLYELFTSKGPSGFGYGSTAEQVTEGLDLQGKTILITGCNSGLGQEALRVLTMRGARVVGTAKGPKIDGFTYKNKSNNRRRWGHRQSYATIEITSIKKG